MSKKLIPNIISFITSLLIGYTFYVFYKGDIYWFSHILASLVAFIFSFVLLFSSFGVSYETSRIQTVISFVGVAFLLVGLLLLVIILIFTSKAAWLIIPIGLLLMLYLAVVYFVSKSNQ